MNIDSAANTLATRFPGLRYTFNGEGTNLDMLWNEFLVLLRPDAIVVRTRDVNFGWGADELPAVIAFLESYFSRAPPASAPAPPG